jgi:hypothetical protein
LATWQAFEQTVTVIGFISSFVGIVSAVFAVLAWNKSRMIRDTMNQDLRRNAENIRLILVREGDRQEHVLGYRPRRDQATRAEILGILGMYSGESRFESSRLVPILESGDFDRMISGSTNELRFTMSDADYDRFVKRDSALGEKQ